MKKIEVCLSPHLIDLYNPTGKTVLIVDIFRATTTMIAALANGITSIIPVKNLEECRNLKSNEVLIAGERDGKKAEGFELGNSPLSFLNNSYAGNKLAMTTTNGTLAIDSVKQIAGNVLIGAFINLEATVEYLNKSNNDLIIYCAGWKGKFNLEDSLYAGAVALSLQGVYSTDCDSTLAVRSLYQTHQKDLKAYLAEASHTKRLQNQNIEHDIDFALSLNLYNTIGILKENELVALTN